MRKIILDRSQIENNFIEEYPIKYQRKKEPMFKYINKIMNSRFFGVGLHNTLGNVEDINSILKNGLSIEKNQSILSTVSSFGTRDKINEEYLEQSILNYYCRKEGEGTNIIVMVPAIIGNSKGEKLFLGFPPYDTTCVGNNYRQTCVLDEICKGTNENGNLPSEFILGYFTNNNGLVAFNPNPNYYSSLSQEQQDDLFEICFRKVGERNKTISKAVIEKDIETLELLHQEEQSKIKADKNINIRKNILNDMLSGGANNYGDLQVDSSTNEVATNALLYLERYLAKTNIAEASIEKEQY